MLASLLFATLALAGHAGVLHQEPTLPEGWAYRALPASTHISTIRFRVSLKQQNLDKLHDIALKVSDPSHSMYGKYLKQHEIDELTAPPAAAVATVVNWASDNGCSASSVRELVDVECPRKTAEVLLSTTCREAFNEKSGQQAMRCSDYSLPDAVHAVTQCVYGLHGLPAPPRAKRTTPPMEPAKVTPDVLTDTYKVAGVTPSGSDKVRQAVAEFQGQTMSSKDLTTFWTKFMTKAKASDGKVYKYVGDPGEGAGETEANLDIQFIMGVSPGILTEFWYFKPMDFCADLKNWTQTILAQTNPPLVHSVSYGWQGNMTTLMGCKMDNVNDVDVEFTKLATRGITIVFASGDSGAGYSPPHTECSPPPGAMKGVAYDGTVSRKMTASSMSYCCEMGSEHAAAGWTYATAPADTCGTQTVLKGIEFEGFSFPSHADSKDECCAQALERNHATWSYNSKTKQCKVFDEVRGRHMDPDSDSGIGSSPEGGECTIFSAITGHHANASATSSSAAKPHLTLWPSWPASSPFVTSVGSTRFVDQKVGQPEMATDQFGSGGGFSQMFPAFDDQKAATAHFFQVSPPLPPEGSFPRGGRGTPDVSALGEGYQVIMHGTAESVGGTSASAPMFAGLISLLNEARSAKGMPAMGYLNPWLYKHPDAFTDITRGDNYRGRGPFVEPYGFNTTVGWDPVTGLGTPQFDKMLSAATASNAAVVV